MAKSRNKAASKKLSRMSLTILFLFGAILALPTTLILCIGALPSIIAFVTDKTRRKARAISITALNLAACSLYLLKLWSHGNDFHYALALISDPFSIVVMYVGAAAGYAIDWFLSGAISQVLYAKAKARQKDIVKRQEVLTKRWGRQITGKQGLSDLDPTVESEPSASKASAPKDQEELAVNG